MQQPRAAQEGELHYGNITLYPDQFKCVVEENIVELTVVEFWLLTALMSQPGRIFTRQDLMRLIYLDDRIVSARTIDSHVKKLRKKLARPSNTDELIYSIYGMGYKIE